MPKLLAQYLQEQQEPFSLDLFLLEKGVVAFDHRRFLKGGPSVFNLKKRQRIVTKCSEFVKAAVVKLVLHRDGKGETRFSCTNVFSSCSESYRENIRCSASNKNTSKGEADADQIKTKGTSTEHCREKQLNPVSVLSRNQSYNLKTTQCESSTSRQESAIDSYSQYHINKRLLQQSKKLLIDCVREVIESHRRRDKSREQLKQILGAEELWKLVCDNLWIWSKDSSIVQHLHKDFLDSLEEWNGEYLHNKEEIAVEIGNDILEGIMNEMMIY